MSYENTHCPCGGKKVTDTMLCNECETEFSEHVNEKQFISEMRKAWDAAIEYARRNPQ